MRLSVVPAPSLRLSAVPAMADHLPLHDAAVMTPPPASVAAPRPGAVAALHRRRGPAVGDVANKPSPAAVDSGDTAWVLTSTALVVSMLLPGLALFYGGLARSGSVLNVLGQCLFSFCMVSVLWVSVGYSLTFSDVGMVEGVVTARSFLGDLSKAWLGGNVATGVVGTLPEHLWFCFQMSFAAITPALVIGAWAERMKWSAALVFITLWPLVVYCPVGHMVWGGPGSLLGDLHALDFAGGLVVHLTSGCAALVSALMLGPRKRGLALAPHNLPMAVTGCGMLLVGWIGFNAGSAAAANGAAAAALAATLVAAAGGGLAWAAADRLFGHRKTESIVGLISGIVAGLVAITPMAGFVGGAAAVACGAIVALVCRFFVETVKPAFGYDDALDVVGIHGVGGFVGNALAGVFAAPALGGNNVALGWLPQTGVQIASSLVVVVWALAGSWLVLAVASKLCGGLRATEADEEVGLDGPELGESAYVGLA